MKESETVLINISHNLSDKEFSRRNLEKYFVFSQVIELLVFLEQTRGLTDCPHGMMVDTIKSCSKGKIKDEEWINRWIAELKFMGAIETTASDSIRFRITQTGYDLYRQQTFQSIYSNLKNAKDSRLLSIVAICISIVAIILSILIH